jgi:hypothetical protein
MLTTHGTVLGQPEVANRLRGAFPRAMGGDVDAVLRIIPTAQLAPSSHDIGPVHLGGDDLRIPYRFYSPEPRKLSAAALTETQRAILNCVYTRHDDGFVREKYLRQLLASREAWVPPFVLQLVGEYVVEIILVVANQIDCLRAGAYAAFVAANPEFLALTRRRIISYWDCYYRQQFTVFRSYPAFQVLHTMGWWGKQDARRLWSR